MPQIVKVYGPAGTGKTTYIARTLRELMRNGWDLDQIGFFSFSRQALQAMADKLEAKTLPPWFRTFHSLGAVIHGFRYGQAITDKEVNGIVQNGLGELVNGQGNLDDYRELYLALRSLSVNTQTPFAEVAANSKLKGLLKATPRQLMQIHQFFEQYKDSTGKMTYDDMLQLDGMMLPELPIVFFDEAQDLSAAQMAIAKRLIATSEKAWVVGDPNQSIYGWAGSSHSWLEDLKADEAYILPRSYRLPKKILNLSNNVLSLMKRKMTFDPKDAEGSVNIVDHIGKVPLMQGGGRWMVLARNKYVLEPLRKHFHEQNILIEELGSTNKSISDANQFLALCQYQQALLLPSAERKGQMVNYIRKYLPEYAMTGVRRGLSIYEGTGLPPQTIEFLLEQFANFKHTRTVAVGTYHASKGLEAENLVLYLKCTRDQLHEFKRRHYGEVCALYVAITRCSQNLYLIPAKQGYPLEEILKRG